MLLRNITAIALFLLGPFHPLFSQWQTLNAPGDHWVFSVQAFQQHLYANGAHGLYRSADQGRSWTSIYPVEYATGKNLRVGADDTYLYVADNFSGLLRSADMGASWEKISTFQINFSPFREMAVTDNYIFVAYSTYLFRYGKNPGATLEPVLDASLVPNASDVLFATRGNDIWAIDGNNLIRSVNSGQSWAPVRDFPNLLDLAIHADTILVKTELGVWRSDDYGAQWKQVNTNTAGNQLYQSGDTWFALDFGGSLRRSIDAGTTWQPVAAQFHPFFFSGIGRPFCQGNLMLLPTGQGLLRTADGGVRWELANGGLYNDGAPFSGGPDFAVFDGALYLNHHFSTDDGATWFFPIYDTTYYLYFNQFTRAGNTYFGINADGRLYKSDDLHVWDKRSLPFPATHAARLFALGNRLFVQGKDPNQIYTSLYESPDQGQTWLLKNSVYTWVLVHNGALFYYGDSQGPGPRVLYKSTDGGLTFDTAGVFQDPRYSFVKFSSGGQNLFLYDQTLIAYSTDDGAHIAHINSNLLGVDGLPAGPDALAATDSAVVVSNYRGIYFSPGFHDQWASIKDNLPTDYFLDKAPRFKDGYLYLAATNGERTLWKRATSDIQLLTGIVYADLNNNGVRDAAELPISGAQLQAGKNEFLISSQNGQYAIAARAPGAGDTLRLILPSPYGVTNPPYYLADQSGTGLDFGIHYPPGITDVRVEQTQETVFRPGFDNKIYVSIFNPGTDTANAEARFWAPPVLTVLSVEPPPSTEDNDTLVWQLPPIPPLGSVNLKIGVNVSVGAALGSAIQTLAGARPGKPDIAPADNVDTLRAEVVGSYDPNDKTCAQGEQITPAQLGAGTALEYTVRFQNTGNYAAETVRIIDMIDSTLLPASLQVLAASHPMTASIREKNVVEFLFPDIQLPPLSQNEPLSHGFVKFALQPRDGLVLGDKIPNLARIYFDFNSPITTNTVVTTVRMAVPAGEPVLRAPLACFPNPATNHILVSLPEAEHEGRLRAWQASGRLILEENVHSRQVRLDCSDWPSGAYTLEWIPAAGGVIRTARVIRQ